MSNIALIFAGGTGQRMNTKTKPKQFLELHGKPIIVYTLEKFQNHPQIDAIIVIVLREWIDYTKELVDKYMLKKVCAIVEGGSTGQESIRNGVFKARELFQDEDIVLVHDGVRPLIDGDTITRAIECTKKHGSAITVSPAIETIAIRASDGRIHEIVDRSKCQLAKAPQCFYLGEIYQAHENAMKDGINSFIDCACMMRYYKKELFVVEGPPENIKITTPSDYYIFRAIIEARENSQIFG